jgi:DNA-binding response OmpR family regulator
MTTTSRGGEGDAPPTGTTGPLPRVLVVDDQPTIVFAISRYLSARGFQVDGAFEIGAALHLLQHQPYEVAVLDLRLEGQSDLQGLEILDLIRVRGLETRVVVLTAHGTESLRRDALRRGADVFLNKPMALPDVTRVVKALVARGPTRDS